MMLAEFYTPPIRNTQNQRTRVSAYRSKPVVTTANLPNNLRVPLPLRLTGCHKVTDDDSILPQSWLAQIARCVTMSISAVEFRLGRWHSRQFFTLITRSNRSSVTFASGTVSGGFLLPPEPAFLRRRRSSRCCGSSSTDWRSRPR